MGKTTRERCQGSKSGGLPIFLTCTHYVYLAPTPNLLLPIHLWSLLRVLLGGKGHEIALCIAYLHIERRTNDQGRS